MDILTQYYNSNGQIVSTSTDLTTRDFYGDHLCQYRFNEEFVPIKNITGPSYSIVDGYVFFNFGGGDGKQIIPVQGLSPFKNIVGRDTRRALIVDAVENAVGVIGTPGDASNYQIDGGYDNFSLSHDCEIAFIFRSPSNPQYQYSNPVLELTIEAFSGNDSSEHEWGNISGASYISFKTSIFVNFVGYQYASNFIDFNADGYGFLLANSTQRVAENATFLTDGGWHIYKMTSLLNGNVLCSVDGQQLCSFDVGAHPLFYNPRMNIVMFGANTDAEKIAIDVGWIKQI